MRYFITGATGFIGSHLAKALAADGHAVKVLIRREKDASKFSEQNIIPVLGELSDKTVLTQCLKDVDVVFHLAALRGGFGMTLEDFKRVNVGLTELLVEECKKQTVHHFIYCSSVSVMGHLTQKPGDESFPYNPATLYGIAKAEAEKMVLSANSQDFKVTVVRPVITYGPGDDWGMLTKLIGLVDRRHYATVGSGRNTVHLCYIDDMVQGLIRASGVQENGKIYIIAGEHEISINELVSLVKKHLGVGMPIFHIPLFLARGIADLLQLLVNMKILSFNAKAPVVTNDSIDIMALDRSYTAAKAKREIGYMPLVDYDEGVKRTVAWYREKTAREERQ